MKKNHKTAMLKRFVILLTAFLSGLPSSYSLIEHSYLQNVQTTKILSNVSDSTEIKSGFNFARSKIFPAIFSKYNLDFYLQYLNGPTKSITLVSNSSYFLSVVCTPYYSEDCLGF